MRFAPWYNESKYADTKIVIKVDTSPPAEAASASPVTNNKVGPLIAKSAPWTLHAVGGAGRVAAEFPGHKIVLSSLSQYFKACFDTWGQDAVIHVYECELPAAQELVKFLYHETLPSNMSSALVLQLLRLAHRYQIMWQCTSGCMTNLLSRQDLLNEAKHQEGLASTKLLAFLEKLEPWIKYNFKAMHLLLVQSCQQSCLKYLSELPEDNWDHANLLDLLYTSEALGDDTTMHVLALQGRSKLKAVFMDFEKSWQDEAKRRLFCELPESAVLELLECDDLQLSSENTMATAIQHWMQGPSGQKSANAEQFVKSLRVAHLTPSYLVNIFPSFSWVKKCPAATAVITESVRFRLISEDFRASQYHASGSGGSPRWLVPRKGMRSGGAGKVCEWLWEVRLQQLRDAVTAVEQSDDKNKFLYGPGFWFNGLCMRACFQVFKVPDEFFGKIFVGLHCGMGSGMGSGIEIPNEVVGIKFELLLTGPKELKLEDGPVFEDHAAVQMNCMWGWSLFNELPEQFNEPFIGHELLTIQTTVKEVS